MRCIRSSLDRPALLRAGTVPQRSGGARGVGGAVEGGPQFGSDTVGGGGPKVVGDHDAFDHVGDHRSTRSALEPDRHHGAVRATADRSVDADEPGRAPKARPDQASPTRLAGEGSGGSGELDGGGGGLHTSTIMTKGYSRVPRPHRLTRVRRRRSARGVVRWRARRRVGPRHGRDRGVRQTASTASNSTAACRPST